MTVHFFWLKGSVEMILFVLFYETVEMVTCITQVRLYQDAQLFSIDSIQLLTGAMTEYSPSHGSYAVQITRDDCIDISDCINFVHPNPQNELGVFVFPNPSTDKITIAKGNMEEMEIRVFDNLGKLLVSQVTQESVIEIYVNDFVAGVYYLHLCIDQKTAVQKIVKQ